MTDNEIPIPIYKLAFLQAYLYEIFAEGKKCEKNFRYTEWYLRGNFSDTEIETIMKYFESRSLGCDCDVLNKIDLKEMVSGLFVHS